MRRFELQRDEKGVVNLLRTRKMTLAELLDAGVAQERIVRLTVYALAMTRHLNLGVPGRAPIAGAGRPGQRGRRQSRPGGGPGAPLPHGEVHPRADAGHRPRGRRGRRAPPQRHARRRAGRALHRPAPALPAPGNRRALRRRPLRHRSRARPAPPPSASPEPQAWQAGAEAAPRMARKPTLQGAPNITLTPNPPGFDPAIPQPRAPPHPRCAACRCPVRPRRSPAMRRLPPRTTRRPRSPRVRPRLPAASRRWSRAPAARLPPVRRRRSLRPLRLPRRRARQRSRLRPPRRRRARSRRLPLPTARSAPGPAAASRRAPDPAARAHPCARSLRTHAGARRGASRHRRAARRGIEKRLETIKTEDYFQVLGVGREAISQEIQNAYFALAKAWRPDRLPELADLEIERAEGDVPRQRGPADAGRQQQAARVPGEALPGRRRLRRRREDRPRRRRGDESPEGRILLKKTISPAPRPSSAAPPWPTRSPTTWPCCVRSRPCATAIARPIHGRDDQHPLRRS